MTEKASDCAVNDPVFFESTSDIMEVCESDDTPNVNSRNNACELETDANADNIKEFEIATVNIKTELPSDEIDSVQIKEEDYGDEEEMVNVKSECGDYEDVDDILLTSKTSMNVTDIDLKDHVKKEIEECEISDDDDIETQTSYDIHNTRINDGIKIEDEIVVKNIHSEFDEKFLSCEHSDEDYQSYCTKCRMLVYCFDKNISSNTENKVIEEIPKNILEIRQSPEHSGIYALKIIPEGVRFGPFMGVNTSNHSLKIRGGKFVIADDKLEFLNWMQYINPAKNILEHNLFAFQYEDNVYYRSIREIQEGEELLVYFGEEYEDSLNNDVEVEFMPHPEMNVEDAFACTFCCLGFSSVIYLAKHKTVCPNKTEGSFLNKDIMQCPHCKIYLEQWEYLEHHMAYCREKNYRQYTVSASKDQTIFSNKPNRRRREPYKSDLGDYESFVKKETPVSQANDVHGDIVEKEETVECVVCKYETNDRSQLEIHFLTKHFAEGKYRCTKCEYETDLRFNLKAHLVKHADVKRFKCTRCDFATRFKHCLKRHLIRHEIVKRFKCSQCEFATNIKDSLVRHFDIHGPSKRFKCPKCDYAAHQRCSLNTHMAKHETVKPFTCSKCDFMTHSKLCLQRHFYTHETVRRYKCTQCDYAGKCKRSLSIHMATHKLKQPKVEPRTGATEKHFKCLQCDYVTTFKSNLKLHSATHGTEKGFKCSQCDYVTTNKYYLKSHFEKHKTDELFKCSECDYVTNQKRHLRQHSSTHDTEKRFKCSQCDYVTNQKRNLKDHSYTHETVKRFRCSQCDFATHSRFSFKEHSDTHESVKRFKCSQCDYATNLKKKFTRHSYIHQSVKRFKCSKCKFETNYKDTLKVHVCKPTSIYESDDVIEGVTIIGIVFFFNFRIHNERQRLT